MQTWTPRARSTSGWQLGSGAKQLLQLRALAVIVNRTVRLGLCLGAIHALQTLWRGLKPHSQTNCAGLSRPCPSQHAALKASPMQMTTNSSFPLQQPPWRSAYRHPQRGSSREHPQGRPITNGACSALSDRLQNASRSRATPSAKQWFARCVAGYPASTLSVQGIFEGGMTTPPDNKRPCLV
jgi:hypothetical protein